MWCLLLQEVRSGQVYTQDWEILSGLLLGDSLAAGPSLVLYPLTWDMEFFTIQKLFDSGSHFGMDSKQYLNLRALFFELRRAKSRRVKFWKKVISNYVLTQPVEGKHHWRSSPPTLPRNVFLDEAERKWVLWALRMPGHERYPEEIAYLFEEAVSEEVEGPVFEDCRCNIDGCFEGLCVHGIHFTREKVEGPCDCGQANRLIGFCKHHLYHNPDLAGLISDSDGWEYSDESDWEEEVPKNTATLVELVPEGEHLEKQSYIEPDLEEILDDLEWDPLLPPLQPQGQTITNIYGSNNSVTSNTGANGWTPTANVNLADGAITSGDASTQAGNGQMGGSSTTKPLTGGLTGNGDKPSPDKPSGSVTIGTNGISGSLSIPVKNWWNQGHTNSTISSAATPETKARWERNQAWLNSKANLGTVQPSQTMKGNATIQTGSAAHCLVAFPPTPAVQLPNPDAPSAPGPSADRTWLVDTFQWTATATQNQYLSGPNAMLWEPSTWSQPMENPKNFAETAAGSYYPLPAVLVHTHPDSTWAAMYNTHSLWNCGWRVQITVNGSQFHAGALGLFVAPQYAGSPTQIQNLFVYPYVICNLYESNTASIEVPFSGPTPNISSGLHCPWTIIVSVLSPLRPPAGEGQSQELTVSLFVTPINSTFHGLRQPRKQHLKMRQVPGSGAFGTVVAGQEIPLCGVVPDCPPVDYLPGEIHDWLEYARRPGIMETIVWTTTEASGTQLALVPVNPATLAQQNAPLASVVSLFSQWRGSLNLHLLFTGATQMYGRLVVAYTPPGFEPPSSMQEAIVGTYTIWDINSAPALDFTLPFISSSYWKTVDMADLEGPLGSSGWVSLWVQTPLQAPGVTPASCDILGFVSAADDFQLRLQQNPVLGFQSGDETIGGGQPSTEPLAVDTFSYPYHPGLPDTVLANYFSFYREAAFSSTTLALPGTLQIPLTPHASNSIIGNLLSAFTYYRGDLRVALEITCSVQQPISLTMAFVPPGATTPSTITQNTLANFYAVTQVVTASATICLSIPYTSPLSALMTQYCGWQAYNSTTFGTLLTNTLGTLVLLANKQAFDSPEEITVTPFFAFGNFRAWLPRPLPPTNAAPATIPKVDTATILRRQGGGEFETPTWAVVVREVKPTHNHWALRSDLGQISLQKNSGQAIIDWEEESGEVVTEVPIHVFEMAMRMVGSPYPYSVNQNCYNWVADLTGLDFKGDTGKALSIGLAATPLLMLGAVKTAVSLKQQGIGDTLVNAATTAASVSSSVKELNLTENVKSLKEVVSNLDLPKASENLVQAAEKIDLPHSTENLTKAAKEMSASITGLQDTLKSLKKETSGIAGDFLSALITILLKVVGYIMVLFGSPSPLSIAGLITLILADYSPDIISFFSSKPLSAVYYLVASKIGLSVKPEEVVEEAEEIKPQGFKEYNDAINAFKNTDWLLNKVLEVVEKILTWLGVKVKEDAKAKVAEKHDDVCALYTDSIAALSSKEVDMDQVKKNLVQAKALLKDMTALNSTTHCHLLTQTIKNYTSYETSERAAGPRPEPVVVYLYGKPGCGKSVIGSLLAAQLAQILTGNPDDVYSTTDTSNSYYDGYTGQSVHFMDDIGQDVTGGDWASFPNLVCTAPYIVPMAALEEKGRLYTSRVIICTSNFPSPTNSSVRALAALERRLHFRIEVVSTGAMTVDEAVIPDGPATRYFAADCPVLRCEMAKMVVSERSLVRPEVNHLDDLIDSILQRVERASSVTKSFSHLIRRQGIESSVVTPLKTAISQNKPLSVIEKFWNYRKPIFAATAFLSALASVTTLVFLARKFTRNQGAYSSLGQPKKVLEKPVPAPRFGLRRQAIPPNIGTIMKNVQVFKVYSAEKTVTAQITFLYSRFGVSVMHLFPEDWTEVEVAGRVFPRDQVEVTFHHELAYVNLKTGPEYKDLRRFCSNLVSQTGYLIGTTNTAQILVNFWDASKKKVNRDGFYMPDAVGYRTASFEGMCGSPCICVQNGIANIVGFHTAGIAGYSGFSQAFDFKLVTQSLMQAIEHPGQPPHINRKTRLVPSPFHGVFPITKEPAALTNRDARLEVNLDETIFSKHNKGDIVEPWKNLEAAFALYFSSFNGKKFRVLSLLEAINGTPELDGIDMHQSAGYPYALTSPRRDFFIETAEGWIPTPEIEKDVMSCIENPDYYYTTHLKDELRPLEKVAKGKTRVIEAAPLNAILAGRMIFGGLFEHMQTNPGRYGSAVGCDPDVNWSTFFYNFHPFSQVFDLDYSAFDSTIPTICFELLAEHLSDLIEHPAVIPYIRSIGKSKHIFGNQAYLLEGGMPSGCVGTSIFNTIINNCVVLSALMDHPDFDPMDYRILAYGDDCLYATNPPIHPNFVKEFFDKNTNFVITPPSKDGSFPEFSDMSTVTFLKRWFEPDDKRPHLIHPVIDPQVYQNSIMWTRGGDIQELVTACCNLAFHAGPNSYAEYTKKLLERAAELELDITIIPYSFLQNRWVQKVSK